MEGRAGKAANGDDSDSSAGPAVDSDDDRDLRRKKRHLYSDDDSDAASQGRDDAVPDVRRPAKAPAHDAKEEDSGLWDPVEASRKKRKLAREQKSAAEAVELRKRTKCFVLHGLTKCPQLNGVHSLAYDARPDPTSGRMSVFLLSGHVPAGVAAGERKLKLDNLREVHRGSLGKLKGLQSAADLNGRLVELGEFDLATGRYLVHLEGGGKKRIKAENLEVVRAFPPERCFRPDDVVRRAQVDRFLPRSAAATCDAGPARWIEAFASQGVPVPQMLSARDLASSSRPADVRPVSGRKVSQTARCVAISYGRFTCGEEPSAAEREKVMASLKHLAQFFTNLEEGQRDVFFLVPFLAVKDFPMLKSTLASHFPYYVKICSELIVLEADHVYAKSWVRVDLLLASCCCLPVYKVAHPLCKELTCKPGPWLLTEGTPAKVKLEDPALGQASQDGKHSIEQYRVEYFKAAQSIEVSRLT